MSYKLLKTLIILAIIGCFLPVRAVFATEYIKKIQAYIPGWTLHHEHLDIFLAALSEQHEAKVYTYCIEENPLIESNMQAKEWAFSWEDTNYAMTEQHAFFKTRTEEGVYAHEVQTYTILTERAEDFVAAMQYISHQDGSNSQFTLMLQKQRALAIEGLQQGKPFKQIFELPVPYSLTEKAIYAVIDSQELEWAEFNPENLEIEIKRANATRYDHLIVVQHLEDSGSEEIFNEIRDIPTRAVMYGLSIGLCNQEDELAKAPLAPMEKMKRRLKRQATEMYTAFSKKHYDEFLGYLPSETITQLGGLRKTLELVSQDPLDGKGTIVTRDIGAVSDIVAEGNGLAAFVPVTTTYNYGGEEHLQQTYMIAFSKDNGHHWKFYSSQGKPEQEKHYKTKFPKLTKTLPYPETFFRPK